MQGLKKIVIIGPESTGKSTLCTQLAAQYRTLCCPEYAREYLMKNGSRYTYDDLLTIAKGQVKLEEQYTKQAREMNQSLLFIDTDMYVMEVWCKFVFGKCHQYILDKIEAQNIELYLLCNIDLPWVKDKLREYPDLATRAKLYKIYKDILINQDVPWVGVSGDYDERLKTSAKAVDNVL